MARTIADKIVDANRAGKEAEFEANGVTYEFSPEGLKNYIAAEGGSSVAWGDVTGKPATFPPTIGSTSTTALAGNTSIPQPPIAVPLVAGTAAIGNTNTYAAGNHVHPAQTSVTGNAGTATALATGRTFTLTGGATGTTAAPFTGAANATISVTLDATSVNAAVSAKAAIAALTAIPTPASATAEQCATAINAIIAALKA